MNLLYAPYPPIVKRLPRRRCATAKFPCAVRQPTGMAAVRVLGTFLWCTLDGLLVLMGRWADELGKQRLDKNMPVLLLYLHDAT